MLRLSDLARCTWFVLFILIYPVSLSAAEYDPEKIFVEINWNQRADGTSDTWYGIYFFDLDNFDLSTVESITMRGPSNSPVCRYTRGGGDQNDFVENQWNGFHVQISNPDPTKGPAEGTYTFEVVTDDFSTTVTHVRDQNIEMPVLDAGTLSPADGTIITSRIPVFEWGAIEDSPVPVYYRFHIWDQSWSSRVYASGRFADFRSIALPEGVLQPGQTYNWGVQILDSSDYTRVENLYLTEYFTITMADTLTPGTNPPAIDLDGWGAVFWRYDSADITSLRVKVTDHDGIANDGSSHQVSATCNGEMFPLTYFYSDSAYEAYYEYWDYGTAPAGEYVFTVTDPDGHSATATDTLVVDPLATADQAGFSLTDNGTSPTITWDPVPGAARYQFRIRDMKWNHVWNGFPRTTTGSLSYTVPPGVLEPDTQYSYNIRARDHHYPIDIDNMSTGENVFFTTDEISQNPLIEIDIGSGAARNPLIDFVSVGAATRTTGDPVTGDPETYLFFRVKVHDAQGVPGNIGSVTATIPDPDGTIPDALPITLALEHRESDTCGIYYAEDSGLPIAAGEYTITVEDMDGNSHSVTDTLNVDPIGYPADSTVNAMVNGTRVDVSWEEIPEATSYRLKIHDMDGNQLHTLGTTENIYTIPAGYLKENTAYKYCITAYRELFERGVDNTSRSVMKIFETGLNRETDMQTLILNTEISNATISRGQSAVVYGTAGINEITLEVGAYAELINFPGSNLILFQSEASLFEVFRNGTIVTFQGSDGTILKIPATSHEQTIIFNNDNEGVSRLLRIQNNRVMLDNQEIGPAGIVL